ncbi:MAG: dienelactone hydrolase family protein [Bacteroidetes bacterium]|nr:dienelactone hydrolase family protein [Bacteroidota bacterium]
MRKIFAILMMLTAFTAVAQQKVIPLYNGAAPGSENWNYEEKMYPSATDPLAYDVSRPTLTVYRPNPAFNTGTAIVVCPGGGFFILAVKNEGSDVADWLTQKGITVFMLKYRTGHSLTDNPGKEVWDNVHKPDFQEKIKPIIPLSIADGRAAIAYARAHAAEYGISPSRIGIMGFSAGGTVAASTAYNYTPENKPDFVAPIYAYMPPALQGTIPQDAPPMFLVAASNDDLGLNTHSVDLYSKWVASGHSAELHMYAKGGHGFGMHRQNIPTDTWIDRFGDWLDQQGFLKAADSKIQKVIEEANKPDWPDLRKYDAENRNTPPPAPGQKRVVFMGNSITEFWWIQDSAFFVNHHYIGRGISGQTTPQMLVRFREDVINLKPAVVVILAGINDIAQNTGPEKIEDIFGNIRSMVELAHAAHIKVVISSVLPANHFPWRPSIDPTEKVIQLNKMLKAYADANNIVYLDYYSAMVDDKKGLPANLSHDGVHPTLEGYKVMEPMVVKAINEALTRKK